MKPIRCGLLAITWLFALASGLQAVGPKEAVLSVKGMVCPA
jgi:hypothetical protein